MQNKEISNLETKDEIYFFISQNPGLHLRELFRKLNLSEGTIRYHIKHLLKDGLITKKIEDRYTRYYPSSDNIKDEYKTIIHFLRKEVTRNIIFYLLICGYGTQHELSENINKSPSTISFHIKKLLKNKIIKQVHSKNDVIDINKNLTDIEEYVLEIRQKIYCLDDPNLIYNFLTNYKEKLFNTPVKTEILKQMDSYIEYKKTLRLKKIHLSVNNYYNLVKEVFSSVI